MLDATTISGPQTAKRRATRARILDPATELLFEHGVAGATPDHVRAVADVSQSQLVICHMSSSKNAAVPSSGSPAMSVRSGFDSA
jgi:hypothetical protein